MTTLSAISFAILTDEDTAIAFRPFERGSAKGRHVQFLMRQGDKRDARIMDIAAHTPGDPSVTRNEWLARGITRYDSIRREDSADQGAEK